MSHLLWKFYWENDVDKFRRLLASAGPNHHATSKGQVVAISGVHLGASPGSIGTSPRATTKPRRTSGYTAGGGRPKDGGSGLTRADLNSRDHAGLTLLLRASSSTNENGLAFVQALIGHPSIDLYAVDPESGWNALHRSLYSGNISIARALLEKERADLTSHTAGSVIKVGQLIKTKDHEGNSPFDLYNSSIAARSLKKFQVQEIQDNASDPGEIAGEVFQMSTKLAQGQIDYAEGDELFVFGSNKNLSLGVGDEDDRQYPERIVLQRPDQLIRHFYDQYLGDADGEASPESLQSLGTVPTLVRNQPLVIKDVVMSKLHSAILTDDPILNLYVCGVGRGGRLGLGDENTQFKFMPVQGPLSDKMVQQIALGQNHSMAIVGNGKLWTWGLNSDSQLGYVLPPPSRADEDPMSLLPKQVFGSLKNEIVLGIAASAIHSVAHTGSSLYCWGRNVGQLALMDADSRSLDLQNTPRKVAASLLSYPIEMVSAIDKATTVLLSNWNVWVFTNYGYNLIKFRFPDVFTNHNLVTSSFSNRYDPGRREIRYIASGGETIAAVTARGDLFTMQLTNKGDTATPAASTTNPVKIKGAVTQPQCIWDSRKDGVTSVSVGEHGSVIICTESGAVWKRVKRLKGKIASPADSSDTKRKDFKFERVPYITDCVTVRSSTFGAFAALRKDSKVMSEAIFIDSPDLWHAIGSLLCLQDFSLSKTDQVSDSFRRPWFAAIQNEGPGTLAHRMLSSPDIETELRQWLQVNSFQYNTDVELCTSSVPDIRIPVHGWLLSGRSSTIREALAEFRCSGSSSLHETFTVERMNGKIVLTLTYVDLLTVLNIVAYIYNDSIIPVWRYTREDPPSAHRFRQVRSELMKVATKLNMLKLEAAARLQTAIERSLDSDLREAINDPSFFDDGDVVIELDGDEVTLHSQVLCQRCPFFDGMFNGRSQGKWLDGRREDMLHEEQVRIDLKHIHPETFSYILAYIYGDVGVEMFDDVTAVTLDEFSELVLDVLSVANELMLDRLAQICQSAIGKFVNTRNIANLMNEISPCAVSVFKDAGLEYICLQLESMLENHFLDGLDEELLQELDEKVRDNQLARLPFAKSGRAELILHETYPDLACDVEEERLRRVKEMAFKNMLREEERKLASASKTRFGSLDEAVRGQETPDRYRRRRQPSQNEPFSPNLRPKDSHADMIFDMDDEMPSGGSGFLSPQLSPRPDIDIEPISKLPSSWQNAKGKTKGDFAESPFLVASSPQPETPELPSPGGGIRSESKSSSPWTGATFSTTKLDMKHIMSEASSKSALTAGLAAQLTKESASKTQTKLSQKERKRQMQMQLEARAADKEEPVRATPWEPMSAEKKQAPWKAAAPIPRTSLQEAMVHEASQRFAPSANVKPLVASESNPQSTHRRTASPDTRFPGQGRANTSALPSNKATDKQHQEREQRRLVPHSKSYMKPTPKTEPTFGLSMADIIGQQQREQELVKEAVAKRSLHEIQQEQAFQEWWDQESRRAQDEEARRLARSKGKDEGSGKRGRRGRGGKFRGSEKENTQQQVDESLRDTGKAGGGVSARGRGGKGKNSRGGT